MQLQTDDIVRDFERWENEYFQWMYANDYSSNTIEMYKRTIKKLIEYAEQYRDEMLLKDLRSNFFDGFILYLEDQARQRNKKQGRDGRYLSKSTKDAYMKAIKGFFSYISDNNDDLYTFEKIIKWSKKRDSSKAEDKLIYLEEDEVKTLIDSLEEKISNVGTQEHFRNSLAVKLMLFAGLRISETLNIRLIDFSLNEKRSLYTISIYAKGGKEQHAYVNQEAVEEELEYFTKEKSHDEYLMTTSSGKKWNRMNAFVVINRIYERVGIKKRGLHLLRHTLAMQLTQKGEQLVVIKKILRHSNIATTTVYSRASPQTIENALESMKNLMKK